MEYFIADTHFNHANIIKYCNRPFETVDEMNRRIITNWNSTINYNDIVYHLGDVGFGDIKKILYQLNGKIILIQGSHDKSAYKYRERFEKIVPLLEISSHGQSITLCHYAMRTWSKSHYNTWHLYAHSHSKLSPIGKSWDVGVDNNDFRPLSFYDIKKIMEGRPDNPNLVNKLRNNYESPN